MVAGAVLTGAVLVAGAVLAGGAPLVVVLVAGVVLEPGVVLVVGVEDVCLSVCVVALLVAVDTVVVDWAVIVLGVALVDVAAEMIVTVVTVAGVVFFAMLGELPKNVVGPPLPVIECPARRSGTVNAPTTMVKASSPVARASRQRGRLRVTWLPSTVVEEPERASTAPGSLVRCMLRAAGMSRAVAVRLAVAVARRIGRRRDSATSATITGAAAAPMRVPGPQMRATVKDAAADATLAMISVCGEMPLGRR